MKKIKIYQNLKLKLLRDGHKIPCLPESTLKRSPGGSKLMNVPWGFPSKAPSNRLLISLREEIPNITVRI